MTVAFRKSGGSWKLAKDDVYEIRKEINREMERIRKVMRVDSSKITEWFFDDLDGIYSSNGRMVQLNCQRSSAGDLSESSRSHFFKITTFTTSKVIARLLANEWLSEGFISNIILKKTLE